MRGSAARRRGRGCAVSRKRGRGTRWRRGGGGPFWRGRGATMRPGIRGTRARSATAARPTPGASRPTPSRGGRPPARRPASPTSRPTGRAFARLVEAEGGVEPGGCRQGRVRPGPRRRRPVRGPLRAAAQGRPPRHGGGYRALVRGSARQAGARAGPAAGRAGGRRTGQPPCRPQGPRGPPGGDRPEVAEAERVAARPDPDRRMLRGRGPGRRHGVDGRAGPPDPAPAGPLHPVSARSGSPWRWPPARPARRRAPSGAPPPLSPGASGRARLRLGAASAPDHGTRGPRPPAARRGGARRRPGRCAVYAAGRRPRAGRIVGTSAADILDALNARRLACAARRAVDGRSREPAFATAIAADRRRGRPPRAAGRPRGRGRARRARDARRCPHPGDRRPTTSPSARTSGSSCRSPDRPCGTRTGSTRSRRISAPGRASSRA